MTRRKGILAGTDGLYLFRRRDQETLPGRHGADTKRELLDGQIPAYRAKGESPSKFGRDLKQTFSHWHNQRHGRRGFPWGERFKSVIVEDGGTHLHCLARLDLNPVVAAILKRPGD